MFIFEELSTFPFNFCYSCETEKPDLQDSFSYPFENMDGKRTGNGGWECFEASAKQNKEITYLKMSQVLQVNSTQIITVIISDDSYWNHSSNKTLCQCITLTQSSLCSHGGIAEMTEVATRTYTISGTGKRRK